MTHAEAELKRLQDAFDKWSNGFDETANGLAPQTCAARNAAELFWPFIAHVLNDPTHSAERTALLNRFKHALGMEMMAHELFGVTLESKGPVK